MTSVPLCPTCQYDLSATPDGRCPECGNEFTHAAIARAAAEPPVGTVSPLAAATCLYLLLSLIAAGMLADGSPAGLPVLVLAWAIAVALAMSVRSRPPHDHPVGLFAALSVLVLIGAGVVSGRASPEWVAIVSAHSMVGGLAAGLANPSDLVSAAQAIRRGLKWAGVAAIIGGVFLLYAGLPLWMEGHRYTNFDTLFSRRFATSGEVSLWGGGFTLAGIATLAVRIVVRRRERETKDDR